MPRNRAAGAHRQLAYRRGRGIGNRFGCRSPCCVGDCHLGLGGTQARAGTGRESPSSTGDRRSCTSGTPGRTGVFVINLGALPVLNLRLMKLDIEGLPDVNNPGSSETRAFLQAYRDDKRSYWLEWYTFEDVPGFFPPTLLTATVWSRAPWA